MTGADHILNTQDLQARLGCETAGEVKRLLRKDGIAYFGLRDKPWTTIDLINAAGMKKTDAQNDEVTEDDSGVM